MTKIALITGATSGIGKATSFALADEGYDLILTGRRNNRLIDLAEDIKRKHDRKVKTLCFDIQKRFETEEAMKTLPESWENINLLINNAGLASGFNHFQNCDISDWDAMIDTNVKGLLYISKIVSGFMISKKNGFILNISSIAGTQVYEKGNVYCASKHAVAALTKAMRIDLLSHGIRVASISPGAVNTEFSQVRFKGDKNRADSVYSGYQPLLAEDIADIVRFIVNRPLHININDVEVTPQAQANAFYINKESIM